MAHVIDTEGTYRIERVRGTDAAFLPGATRATGDAPRPIAFAKGAGELATSTGYIWGPSGVVGAGENWILKTTVPAQPDLCWVVVGLDFSWTRKPAADIPVAAGTYSPYQYWAPTVADSIATVNLGAGSYAQLDALEGPQNRGLWIPLDPAKTKDGFEIAFMITAGAGGLAVDDLALWYESVLVLGYPANVWGTGDLWDGYKFRGS